jgi:hypothetical protein
MRTIRVKLYTFEELSEDIQSKVLDKFRNSQVEYNDWYDSDYDDFKTLCATVGIEVDEKKTYFSGFSSQGDGAGFTSHIDLKELVEGIANKKYLEHAPNIHDEVKSFTPSPCPVDKRVLDLIYRNVIDISINTKGNDRPFSSKLEFWYNYTSNECVNYKNVEKQMNELEEWLEDTVNEFTNLLYRLLERDYEYLTSDESVKEHIIANEYEFTKDGKQH